MPHGYAVHAVDLRGHGRSPGTRGHITRFGDYVDDTLAFAAAVRGEHSGCRVYLLGHSLGGLIAALCAENDDGFDGLILSSPFIRVGLPVSRIKIVAARLPFATDSDEGHRQHPAVLRPLARRRDRPRLRHR